MTCKGIFIVGFILFVIVFVIGQVLATSALESNRYIARAAVTALSDSTTQGLAAAQNVDAAFGSSELFTRVVAALASTIFSTFCCMGLFALLMISGRYRPRTVSSADFNRN